MADGVRRNPTLISIARFLLARIQFVLFQLLPRLKYGITFSLRLRIEEVGDVGLLISIGVRYALVCLVLVLQQHVDHLRALLLLSIWLNFVEIIVFYRHLCRLLGRSRPHVSDYRFPLNFFLHRQLAHAFSDARSLIVTLQGLVVSVKRLIPVLLFLLLELLPLNRLQHFRSLSFHEHHLLVQILLISLPPDCWGRLCAGHLPYLHTRRRKVQSLLVILVVNHFQIVRFALYHATVDMLTVSLLLDFTKSIINSGY